METVKRRPDEMPGGRPGDDSGWIRPASLLRNVLCVRPIHGASSCRMSETGSQPWMENRPTESALLVSYL